MKTRSRAAVMRFGKDGRGAYQWVFDHDRARSLRMIEHELPYRPVCLR
jgi:hypothetical protein